MGRRRDQAEDDTFGLETRPPAQVEAPTASASASLVAAEASSNMRLKSLSTGELAISCRLRLPCAPLLNSGWLFGRVARGYSWEAHAC